MCSNILPNMQTVFHGSVSLIHHCCSTRKTLRYGCDGLDWIKPSQSAWGMAMVWWISLGSCQSYLRYNWLMFLNAIVLHGQCWLWNALFAADPSVQIWPPCQCWRTSSVGCLTPRRVPGRVCPVSQPCLTSARKPPTTAGMPSRLVKRWVIWLLIHPSFH